MLHALDRASPLEAAFWTLQAAGALGAPLRRLALLAGRPAERVADELLAAGARRLAGELMVDAGALAALARAVLEALTKHLAEQPNGVARRRLASLTPPAALEVLDAVLAELAAAGRLKVDGATVRLPPPRAEAEARVRAAATLAARLEGRLRSAGLAPPSLADIAAQPIDRRVLEHLLGTGAVVKTLDRAKQREVAFHREAIAEARRRLLPHLDPPGLTTGEAGALLGMTRRFSVPLLEHLDSLGFTRRDGDRRVLGPRAGD